MKNIEKSPSPLDKSVDFIKLCSLDRTYEGVIDKNCLLRVTEAVKTIDDHARYSLHFYKDLQGINVVEGEVFLDVTLICQRCSLPFKTTLCAQICATCEEEKAQRLKIVDNYDFFDLNEHLHFDLYDYLEDCLILEVPIIPRHENDDECQLTGNSWTFGQELQEPKDNPFAILKDLKLK